MTMQDRKLLLSTAQLTRINKIRRRYGYSRLDAVIELLLITFEEQERVLTD